MKTVKEWFEEIEDPRVMWFLLERMPIENEKIQANSLKEAILNGMRRKEDDCFLYLDLSADPVAFIIDHLKLRQKDEPTQKPQPYYGLKNSPHEVHKFISAHNLNFNRGCVVKCAVRAGRKDPKAEIEDLEKAIDYLKFEIERLKEIS